MKRRQIRHLHLRKELRGSSQKPRLAVFRSNSHIYAQVIDDDSGKTLAFVSDLKVTGKSTKSEKAYQVGKSLAEAATKKGIKEIVFDRGGFLYHGRIAKVAEGAREGGLKF